MATSTEAMNLQDGEAFLFNKELYAVVTFVMSKEDGTVEGMIVRKIGRRRPDGTIVYAVSDNTERFNPYAHVVRF